MKKILLLDSEHDPMQRSEVSSKDILEAVRTLERCAIFSSSPFKFVDYDLGNQIAESAFQYKEKLFQILIQRGIDPNDL